MSKSTSPGIFSSDKDDWETPHALFNHLNEMFNFTLDPCASHTNHKCDKYYTIEDDGLTKDWSNEVVFVNPPYGGETNKWIKKSYEESLKGALVVCLIPARTDTKYWHEYIMRSAEICLIQGRIRFNGENRKTSSPFPSALIIFDGEPCTMPILTRMDSMNDKLPRKKRGQ